jgi:photosystem II stability/assembly factor-like uncharacterized protein
MKKLILPAIGLIFICSVHSQSTVKSLIFESMENGQAPNFYDIKKAWKEKEKTFIPIKENNSSEIEEQSGMPGSLEYGRWEEFIEPRVYPTGDISLPAKEMENYKQYLENSSHGYILRNGNLPDASSQVLGNWQSLGPTMVTGIGQTATQGKINFIRFDPANSSNMFAGSRTGGLWKSVNAGSSWSSMTDNLPFIGCEDLAISNSNSNKMYMAAGTVGGADYIYGVDVLKTLDGGISWNAMHIPTGGSHYSGINCLVVHPLNDDIVLVAAYDGLYKTSDGGTSWTKILTGAFLDIKFKPGDPTIVYATQEGTGSVSFYVSNNTGDSFNQVTSGLQTQLATASEMKIGVSPANPQYVYLVALDNSSTKFNGIYRSVDSGMNFTTQTDSSFSFRIQNYGEYFCVQVNPANAEDVYWASTAPYRSTDGGVTWTATGGYIYVDIHDLQFLPGSSTTIVGGCDGGIAKSLANGANWTYLSNGLQILQMYKLADCPYNSNKVLTGQQDVGVHLYNSGTWTNVFQFDGMDPYFDPVDTNIIYISQQRGGVLKSTDGGLNFNYVVFNWNSSGLNGPGNWTSPFLMSPLDHNTLFIGKDSVYRSVDAGATWQSMPGANSFLNFNSIACSPTNANYIYASTGYNFFACTNGNSFTQRIFSFPGYISSIAVSNVNPEKVWVALSGYSSGNKVYASTDAGVTWTDWSDGLPNLPLNCIVYHNNSNDKLYVGMDIGIYFRDASMPSWENFSNGLPNVQIRELEINYASNKMRAATYGRGLWESEIDLTSSIPDAKLLSDNFSVFPDPNDGKFSIRINPNSQNKKIEFNLFNSMGECVYSKKLVNEFTSFEFNISAGIYLGNLAIDGKIISKRIIVR